MSGLLPICGDETYIDESHIGVLEYTEERMD